MCSEKSVAAGYTTAEDAPPAPDAPDDAEWRHAVSELEDVDNTIKELREELEQFMLRREVVAKREASLRQRLAERQGKSADTTASEGSGGEVPAPNEPMMFSMGMDDGDPLAERATSLEDWEQGFDIINQASNTRDRASAMRARMLLSSNKSSQ